jgi:formate dehydrogenase iron-sulfur subunit
VPSHDSLLTPVDRILEEQQNLTAVERFARHHEKGGPPAQQRYYRDLIPLTAPKPGQQYAFEVNLDRCSGCQACVTACHSLNGLDDDESWRSVGLLFSDDWRTPYQAPVTMACHHCVDPGCLTGCPVLAYDKDPVTGIVRHLDDQCIGCKYCVMKCPYDVPKYSEKRGIVRKCDMCSSRLDHGEAPACVQACPTHAIRITVVDQATVAGNYRGARASQFLPSSPPPGLTVPTTRYISARPIPESLLAGDHAHIAPAPAHLPLVFMLVLSQLSVGAAMASLFARPARWLELVSACVGAAALGIGMLHLGRPSKAWRSFLGWRTSWFSREVVAFAGFIPLSAASAAFLWISPASGLNRLLPPMAAASGVLAVACSAMIYVDTRREFWGPTDSFVKFLGTTLLLGSSLALALAAAALPAHPGLFSALVVLVAALASAKLAFEQRIFGHLGDGQSPGQTPLNRTARLLSGELGPHNRARIFCGAAGGVLIPALVALCHFAGVAHATAAGFLAFALCLTGEIIERYLFFTAVAPARMPGAA